jgi:hypothetical protein
VIAGEMKTGTTSLAFYLDEHPEIAMATRRPVRFFDDEWSRGTDWYADQFPTVGSDIRLGDDTPNYLFDPRAVERMAATLPDARIVVMLRDPVDRAWSHYWHHDRFRFDRRGFRAAIEHEFAEGVAANGTPEGSAYVARGRYVDSLARLFEHYDRGQIFVGFQEDLDRDADALMRSLFGFLGVDPSFRPPSLGVVFNRGWAPKSHLLTRLLFRLRLWDRLPDRVAKTVSARTTRVVREHSMDDDLHDRLRAHYEQPDTDLEHLLGRPLPWR